MNQFNRREFIRDAGAMCAALGFPSILRSATATPKRPNVLFISVDDMNTDAAFWGGGVRTPHLARLARSGVQFDRAYCQYPLCNPSRASMMTGLRPDRIRVFDLEYHFRTEIPEVVTLPQLFRQSGYYVARVGKIYHAGNPSQVGQSGLDDPLSWDEVLNPAGRDKTELLSRVTNYTPSRPGLGASMAWYADPEGSDAEFTDGKVASQAIRLLEAHRGEPFFLGVGFYKPHCPYIAPKRYFDMYPLEGVSLPELPPGYAATVPHAALASTDPWPSLGVSPDHARAAKRGYQAVYSFVDAQIGRVLDALDRLGLRETTIIVFWSDHGYLVGEHGLWFKQSCFEEAARVPLIISAPGIRGSGRPCPRVVEHVDVYPTIAALAGIGTPKGLAGRSLRSLLDDPTAVWGRAAHTQIERKGFPGWSVRTERWRYTVWDEGRQGRELYDHANDAREMMNLADDPRYAEVQADLQRQVTENWPKRVLGGVAQPGSNPG